MKLDLRSEFYLTHEHTCFARISWLFYIWTMYSTLEDRLLAVTVASGRADLGEVSN